ncbi:MAG: hypothetical protein JO272_06850 [Pseudonocardiales bacterium]|nr:hypothetical protein [Pseudonocardiales bacterium]
MDLIEIDRKIMNDIVVEKTWEIPAHADKGPVTITLRMPEVRVTDSEGRHIVISPAQADLVSTRMSYIVEWMCEAARSGTEEDDD